MYSKCCEENSDWHFHCQREQWLKVLEYEATLIIVKRDAVYDWFARTAIGEFIGAEYNELEAKAAAMNCAAEVSNLLDTYELVKQ